jgi:hypothetical protein
MWVVVDGRQRWECELCQQVVNGVGPWCDLYCTSARWCRPLTKQALDDADASGDGSMVNALCSYGRRRWGPDLDW